MNSNYTAALQPKKALSEMTPDEQAQAGAEALMGFMASCPGKTVMSGVTGFALGGFFGLFMASMAYDVPVGGGVSKVSDLPFKTQMKLQFSDMGRRSYTSAKNFGYIGMIYSGVECAIESFRAKNDIYNGVSAGCITGGGLAVKAGPQAAAIGCAGFAAFSVAIDLYLRLDAARPPANDYDD
ncbi:hypothetical protein BABINDRAFT_162838 [Babjeviella inositovora NRRL Y-12698]|uniref:Mitochondrial import inner membrane translocase subunit TIM22 n=1 Tax=Babjeviella inositovora NRRL Y-12698 TaxID=984486 RepID=A0A1E3QKD5_9ASCO|nr:uncharacterized protein BABINDRAFT_162838 [Babjeviella inositovora NRRL Y-12698]ODQ78166.1 hypothetical protein BABINDRAFT_162838 [Babjeviella inositovora NRRL Y-12698]